jgi:uncharacterized membrane protein YgdD (TMEM256/DUF423 family)
VSRGIAFSLLSPYSSPHRHGIARVVNMIGVFAAISAAVAVAAGAFGAHGAAGPQEAEWLRTGGLYQLIHAVAAIAIMGTARGPAIMLLVGAALFAVTLYAMALGGPRWLGAVTPIGGTLLIVGWLWAGWLYWRG